MMQQKHVKNSTIIIISSLGKSLNTEVEYLINAKSGGGLLNKEETSLEDDKELFNFFRLFEKRVHFLKSPKAGKLQELKRAHYKA